MRIFSLLVLAFLTCFKLNAKDVEFYVCRNGWALRPGDTIRIGIPKEDSIGYYYTKTPWSGGKSKPFQLPKVFGNRQLIIKSIEKHCYKEECFVALHVKSDTLEEGVFYIDNAIDDEVNRSSLIVPKDYRKYNSCPILISRVTVARNSIGAPVVRVKFANIGNKTLVGIRFKIACYNSLREEVAVGTDGEFSGLFQHKLNPTSSTVAEWTLYLYENATKFSVYVDKIEYEYAIFNKPWEGKDHVLDADIPENARENYSTF